jgi:dGTPase
MMNWEELLKPVRFRDKSTIKSIYDARNEFENDYSRLVFSSPFRRLQDKAQVFPLDNSDFVRTRLTHSIEVSTFARSIGISVEDQLITQHKLDEKYRGHISAILANAGLVHDIGNTPFGHFGEFAMQAFYKNFMKFDLINHEDKFDLKLNDAEKADFTNFDGNVQAFRLLKKLQYLKDEHSYNLTYPTLATVIKYPRSSTEGNNKSKGISYKKFGYFQSEKVYFDQISEELGFKGYRYPLTFLLEAADDIAFSVADIEDGCKKGILEQRKILQILEESLKDASDEEKKFIDIFKDEITNIKDHNADEKSIAVQNFRIKVQSFMIQAVIGEFLDHHDDILNGNYETELLKNSKAKNLRKAFEEMSYIIFDSPLIIKKELVGYKIISFFLEEFIKALLSDDHENPKTKNGKLNTLLSNNYKFIKNHFPYTRDGKNNELYNRLQLVNDYICGMTDSFALNLYQKLSGINLDF